MPYLIREPEQDPAESDRLLPERIATLTARQIVSVPGGDRKAFEEIEAWLWERDLALRREVRSA